MARKLLYCNVNFDLQLQGTRSETLSAITAESTLYYLLVGDEEDHILLDIDIPDSYYRYLKAAGLSLPVPATPGQRIPDFVGLPYGWNRDARNRFAQYGVESLSPSDDNVKKANSRLFSYRIASKYGFGVPRARSFPDTSQALDYLTCQASFPCVVKPEFGNAGIGFVHIRNSKQIREKTNLLRSVTSRPCGNLFIEEWLPRTLDISTLVEISSNGQLAALSHHRTLNNAGGVFYGIHLDPDNLLPTPWKKELNKTATLVSQMLYEQGYWGPAGIDSFVTIDENGKESLVPCIEINARQPMSILPYSLQRQIADEQHVLFMFAPARRYQQITSYPELFRKLGADAYDPVTKRGVLVFTPLFYSFRKEIVCPRKIGFFMVAKSTDEVFVLDAVVRKRLGRNASK